MLILWGSLKRKILKFTKLAVIRRSPNVSLEHTKMCYLDALSLTREKGKPNIQRIDYNAEIFLTYNTKNVHSSTGLTPKQAREPKNEIETKLNISIKATQTRKYPNLDVGDSVKVMRKKGITLMGRELASGLC